MSKQEAVKPIGEFELMREQEILRACIYDVTCRRKMLAQGLNAEMFVLLKEYAEVVLSMPNELVGEHGLIETMGRLNVSLPDKEKLLMQRPINTTEPLRYAKEKIATYEEMQAREQLLNLAPKLEHKDITYNEYIKKVQKIFTESARNRGRGIIEQCRNIGALGWLDTDPPEQEATLTRNGKLWLPKGKTGMLVAKGGTGKTQALIQLAISVATGKQWLGMFDIPKRGKVLIALGEEGPEDMQRRIWRAANGLNLSDNEKQLVKENVTALPLAGVRCSFLDKDNKETSSVSDFDIIVKEQPWSLIILDPASRFMGPDAEGDNASATRFIEVLESWAQLEHRPTVLFAHHSSKQFKGAIDEQAMARGSSALTDGVRWQANMIPIKTEDGKKKYEGVALTCVKSNDGVRGDRAYLKFDENNGLLKLEDDHTKKRVFDNYIKQDEKNNTNSSRSKRKSAETEQYWNQGGI
jgi:hypothetical protein